jgi:hypothetical protein
MTRIAKSALAVISGLALVLGLVSGATAKPAPARHAGTKIVKPINKPASSAAKKAAAKKAAAKRAAEKKAAAKKAAAKKAAAKRAAEKKAAAKRAAAKKAAEQRLAAKKAAESRKQAARKTLLDNILNSVTPDAPADLPTKDESQTDPAGSDMASMPIRCMAVYQNSKSPCGWYNPYEGKPTAQQFAFNEALQVAYSDQAAANQVAYEAFEAATVDARDALNQMWTSYYADESKPKPYADESTWMQVYVDYLAATRDAQTALNKATLISSTAFVEAKFVAIADFDAATFDATTDEGAAALVALADYREASKAVEFEQFSKNLSDSEQLNEGVIARMQAYLDLVATLDSEADVNAARDAYYLDLNTFYTEVYAASSEYLQSLNDAANAAEEAFVALTGSAPLHPEYYPWWWYGYDDPIIVIDPVPGDCVEEPLEGECLPTGGIDPVPCEGDECEVVPYLPPGETGGIDPIPGDEEPEIAICPPFPGEFEEYPRPLPPETDSSDSSDNVDAAGNVDDSQSSEPVDPTDGPTDPDCWAPVIK